jgi:hypothetical protein
VRRKRRVHKDPPGRAWWCCRMFPVWRHELDRDTVPR